MTLTPAPLRVAAGTDSTENAAICLMKSHIMPTRGTRLHSQRFSMQRNLSILLMTLAMSGTALGQAATRVEVFANSSMVITPHQTQPAQSYQLVIYRLDAIKQLEAQINRHIPKTEAAAREYFARNEAQLKHSISPAVINAANGITLVNHYRIERIPAIVIDGKSVIYGITDVEQALALYRRQGAQR